MHITVETFCTPRQGCTWADYEDAYYPKQVLRQTLDTFKCAVADGATETVFCDKWAYLLVKAYCENKLSKQHWLTDLRQLQYQWHKEVNGQSLPWYIEQKRLMGAYATFVGLTLYENYHLAEVIAIGDSCLFQIRAEQLNSCLPLQQAKQFNNTPFLISSHLLPDENLVKATHYEQLTWLRADEFYLMTDALALWFLQEYERCHKPWQILRQLTTSSFSNWVYQLKTLKKLQNDDITLMRIFIY